MRQLQSAMLLPVSLTIWAVQSLRSAKTQVTRVGVLVLPDNSISSSVARSLVEKNIWSPDTSENPQKFTLHNCLWVFRSRTPYSPFADYKYIVNLMSFQIRGPDEYLVAFSISNADKSTYRCIFGTKVPSVK